MDQVEGGPNSSGHASWWKVVRLKPGTVAFLSADTAYTTDTDGSPITTTVEILSEDKLLKRSESHGVSASAMVN
jgi:hypothetical protein